MIQFDHAPETAQAVAEDFGIQRQTPDKGTEEIKRYPTDGRGVVVVRDSAGGLLIPSVPLSGGVHWDLQLSKPDVVLGDTQAWYMREVQAYDLEIRNSSRFNLSPAEVKSLKENRAYDLNGLNSWNRSSVESGVYKP